MHETDEPSGQAGISPQFLFLSQSYNNLSNINFPLQYFLYYSNVLKW